ncbi:hypothetical protein THRCLA_20385 [Thraustotheca clavata]|uniref:Uncharacterized protein n=1 Tax=Thraustotheca clavata TaxID=74557 RepID=A0A1W0A891_9STRA|nr:hypothetical protein THRCLA_20385 [Thraustotheca clavata]
MSTASRRPQPVRRAAGASRRRVEKRNEIETVQDIAPPAEYVPPQVETLPTVGQELKSSFLWGVGMALGFSMLGVVARVFMEEAPKYEVENEHFE